MVGELPTTQQGDRSQLRGHAPSLAQRAAVFVVGDLYIGIYLPKLRHYDRIPRLAKALRRTSSTDCRVFLAGLLFPQQPLGHIHEKA